MDELARRAKVGRVTKSDVIRKMLEREMNEIDDDKRLRAQTRKTELAYLSNLRVEHAAREEALKRDGITLSDGHYRLVKE